jgi:serine/threonine protein kinase
MTPMIGTTVAGLELLSRFGGTRVGELYIGSCADGRCLVKILQPEACGDRARVEHAFATARKLGELDHRGIEFVIEAGWDKDHAYVLGDIVPGSTVAWLLEKRAFREDTAAAIVRIAADALAAAHAQGVYHHALEPLLVHVGFAADRVIVRDFGLATLVASEEAKAYRAPELDGAPDSAAGPADVYALGKIGLEMLASATPDDELKALLDRMVAGDPAARPTAAEVRDTLAVAKPEVPSVVAGATFVNAKPSERDSTVPRVARAAWRCGDCDSPNGAEHIFCLACSAPMSRGIPYVAKDIATLMSALAGDFADEDTPPPGPPPKPE